MKDCYLMFILVGFIGFLATVNILNHGNVILSGFLVGGTITNGLAILYGAVKKH